MNNKTKWDQLSLSQKAGLIKIYVDNGFSDIDSIREDYNKNIENFQSNNGIINNNNAIIYPSVQEHNGTLVDYSEDNKSGLESAIQQKDTIRTSIPFAEWYTKNYKKDYSEFFNRYNKFKDGGFSNNKDKQQNNNEGIEYYGKEKNNSLFNKEKVLNRVYGDNMGTSTGPGSSFPIISAIIQYLTNKDSAVSDRIEYLEKIRKLLPEKTPDAKDNLMKRKLAGEISDKELWEGVAAYSLESIKQHEDAKRIYLGYEPKYGTMEPSQYQPTIGKASNPYQVNNLLTDVEFENTIFPLWQQWKSGDITDFVITGKWNGKKQDFEKEPRIENYGSTALIKDVPYLNNATLSEGFDNKGHYISLFDTWDYNTGYMGKSGDNIGKWIGGKPFDIYQRYYLDEWLDIPEEERGHPYLAPAVITADRKTNGGFINTNNEDEQQNNNEQRLLTKDSLYNYINTDKRKSTWKKQGFNGWTDSDLDYLYEKLNTTGWDERAVLYAIDKETNFRTHVKNPVSSAIGLAQLTKAQMKTLFGNAADKIYEEYSNGTRSVKDVIDDTIKQYKWMYDRIKSEKDNMGYGRLKVNLLAPNASLDSIISNNLYENSLTPLQKLKIKKGKSTYRDLMTMYDEEFKNNFK